jgi:hypothetical protein
MKNRKWLFTACLTVLLFALLLNPPSRSSRRAWSNTKPAVSTAQAAGKDATALDSAAGRRWIQGQPNHWRACLLQQ